jgi:CubicO group peptidase (beta-lactamase class C family)
MTQLLSPFLLAASRAATIMMYICLLTIALVPDQLTAAELHTTQRKQIDQVVAQAIARHQLPGAVVEVVHRGHVIFRRAYGSRSLRPTVTPMTTNTVFDLASLTKPLATATAIMILLEQGKLQLDKPVAHYWPEFAVHGKEWITVEQLLLHTSCLIPDDPLDDYRHGRVKAWERIAALTPLHPAGTRFMYSDVNYIILGELVERISGQRLDAFTRQHIYEPLGLHETGFRPPPTLRRRAAPTEMRDGHWMMGEVHDPRAYLLGGVAGHAGLFSTADEVAVLAQMFLNEGQYHGKRILRAESVRSMTRPRRVPGGFRALGWDVQTAYSSNRGTFPFGSYGHTGFTGTSIWLDPGSQTAVIILTNRVHPDGKGDVRTLRKQIATIVANSVGVGSASLPIRPD